ncbi:hypothetical protein Tco_1430481 [Tanacetum coccineum]
MMKLIPLLLLQNPHLHLHLMHHQKLHQPKTHLPLLEPPHPPLNQNHVLHLSLQETHLLLNPPILFLMIPWMLLQDLQILFHFKAILLWILLSLSPITSLDNMFETPSPPLPPSPPPPPQPPIMGHPIYFNVLDYHGAYCLCCFHNLNLILSLRDEMHFMFSHIKYLLTSVIASPSPPHN